MFDSKKLADVIIITKGRNEIKASNFILSRSEVFDAMLNVHDTKEAREKTIVIKDVDYHVMSEMIRYMYTDEVPKMNEMALNLMIAANKYNLPGLVSRCENYLKTNITVENFGNIIVVADTLNITELKEVAIQFIIDNHEKIFDTNMWKTLKLNHVQLGMEVMERCFLVLHKKMNK
jgi:hypothetical protein